MYPKLKFYLDERLDREVGIAFFNLHKGGVSFGRKILRDHPSLGMAHKGTRKRQEEVISAYVRLFYRKHFKELERAKEKFQNKWDKNARDFFTASDRFFAKRPWPKGRYHANISIFDCNPRFLETKTFQVFWRRPKPLAVIAHEMLHFLFYDSVEHHFSKVKIGKEPLWQLSEIVNSFVLAEPMFVKITQNPTPSLYPDLVPLARELLPLWKKTGGVPSFLRLGLTKLIAEGKQSLSSNKRRGVKI